MSHQQTKEQSSTAFKQVCFELSTLIYAKVPLMQAYQTLWSGSALQIRDIFQHGLQNQRYQAYCKGRLTRALLTWVVFGGSQTNKVTWVRNNISNVKAVWWESRIGESGVIILVHGAVQSQTLTSSYFICLCIIIYYSWRAKCRKIEYSKYLRLYNNKFPYRCCSSEHCMAY